MDSAARLPFIDFPRRRRPPTISIPSPIVAMDTLVASTLLHFSSDGPVELTVAASAALELIWACMLQDERSGCTRFRLWGKGICRLRDLRGDSQTTLLEGELVDWEWIWMKVPRSRDYE